MNFSFRLENSCMRFKDSLAESLTRLGRSIFNSLILSCFLTTGDLRNKLVTLDLYGRARSCEPDAPARSSLARRAHMHHTAKQFTKNRALPGKGKLLITA